MTVISLPPQRVICDASNKPASSATAFELSATGVTGFLLPVNSGEVTSGNTYIWLAEEIDGDGNPSGAWQTFEGVYTDAATDTISQDTLLQSSTGSFIDWSATGVDANARLTCIDVPDYFERVEITAGVSSVDFTLDAGYTYMVDFSNIEGDTDNDSFCLRTSADGGSTFDAGGSDYQWAHVGRATSSYDAHDAADAYIVLNGDNQVGTAADEGTSGCVSIFDPGAAKYTRVTSGSQSLNDTPAYTAVFLAGSRKSAAAVDAIRFMMASGNIDAGVITLHRRPA